MFGRKKDEPGMQMFFGPDGDSATVLNSGSGMFTVMGSSDHDGVYFKSGDMVMGPDGPHFTIGTGPVKTVFGPGGEMHTIIENGFGGTVL